MENSIGQNGLDKVDMTSYLELPEILEHFFSFLNHETLKVCRFVNSLWNIEACRLLRKKSVIFLWERDSIMLKNLETSLKANQERGLPLPFELFHLEIESLKDPALLEIISNPWLKPLKLVFNQPPKNGYSCQENVEKLLQQRTNRLQYIHFALGGEEYTATAAHEGARVQAPLCFPELQTIQLLGNSNPYEDPEHVNTEISNANYISRIINSSPQLKTFESSFCAQNTLLHVFCNANLKNIDNLQVFHMTPYLFRKLKTLSLPKLKTFYALINPDLIEENFVASQTIHRVVQSFASTIEDLFISWNFNSIDDNFPRCPKLKRLAIKFWSGSLAAFNEKNLPSLKIFHVYDCINESGPRALYPHYGVDTFAFECMAGTGVRFGLYSEQDFAEIMLYAQQQFPNITCLDLNLALTTKSLQVIVTNFPLLEKLILDSNNEYREILTGIEKFHLERLLATGSDLNSYSKSPCISDLKELKHLVLSRHYDYRLPYAEIVTDNTIIYGLSRLQKMEFLQFDWEAGISPKVIQKFFSEIETLTIVINYSEDIPRIDTLFALKKMMPQIQLNRRAVERRCNRIRRSSTRRPRHRNLQLG